MDLGRPALVGIRTVDFKILVPLLFIILLKRWMKVLNNNKKSRVTDLFRKLDEDADGFLSRDDFIEGILKNKFPSSRLEMNAVADKFDHGDGQIDVSSQQDAPEVWVATTRRTSKDEQAQSE